MTLQLYVNRRTGKVVWRQPLGVVEHWLGAEFVNCSFGASEHDPEIADQLDYLGIEQDD